MKTKQEFDKITVALICFEEKEQLALILEDLKKQSFLKSIKEVLLLQNAHPKRGLCQKTKEIAESFKKELPLVFLSSKENHLGLARAQLIKKAHSEWVAFTDSDCRLPENWLESLVENAKSIKLITTKSNSLNKGFNRKKVVAIGGPNRLPENKFWKKMTNLSLDFPIGHGFSPQAWISSKVVSVSHIPTTNGLFLKSAVLKAGNFSSSFAYVGEDFEMGKRLKNQEGELLLFPKPLVINNYAFSYLKSLKRLFTFGLVQNKNKGLLFYLSLFFFPLFVGSFIGVFTGVLKLLLSSSSTPIIALSSIKELKPIVSFLTFQKSEFILLNPLSIQTFYVVFLFVSFTFLFCYFLLLLVYSFKACIKIKKLSPLILIFFWMLQHISYSSGVCLGFALKLINLKQKEISTPNQLV